LNIRIFQGDVSTNFETWCWIIYELFLRFTLKCSNDRIVAVVITKSLHECFYDSRVWVICM